MIKKRIVKCEWKIALEYRDNHGDYNLIEVLETYNTREAALKDWEGNKYSHVLNGTTRTLSFKYNEEILSEEIVFSVGDKVRFVVANFNNDIESNTWSEYRRCIDKVGTVTYVAEDKKYMYDVDFNGKSIPFASEELELAE